MSSHSSAAERVDIYNARAIHDGQRALFGPKHLALSRPDAFGGAHRCPSGHSRGWAALRRKTETVANKGSAGIRGSGQRWNSQFMREFSAFFALGGGVSIWGGKGWPAIPSSSDIPPPKQLRFLECVFMHGSIQDRLIVTRFAKSGLRVSEVIKIRRRDFEIHGSKALWVSVAASPGRKKKPWISITQAHRKLTLLPLPKAHYFACGWRIDEALRVAAVCAGRERGSPHALRYLQLEGPRLLGP